MRGLDVLHLEDGKAFAGGDDCGAASLLAAKASLSSPEPSARPG